MNFPKNISTKWVIGILAVMNIALLSFILMAPGASVEKRSKDRSSSWRTSKFLQKELGLTDEEATVFKDLQKEHFKLTKEKWAKVRSLKKEMFAALNLDTPDKSKAKTIATQIGQEQQLIEELMIDHYLELRSKCTSPEQLKKLEQVFEKAISRKRSRGKKGKKASEKGCK